MRLLQYNPNPYDAPGTWLRCNFHAHSTIHNPDASSDDMFTPEELAVLYREEGYDVLCLTDEVDKLLPIVESISDDKLLVLPGAEMGPLSPPSDHSRFHILGINMNKPIQHRELLPGLAIREINEQGAVAVLAHPAWGGHHINEMLGVEGYIGIEVYNYLSQRSAKGFSDQIWNQIIDLRGLVWGFASDDIHSRAGAFGGWVWLKAEEKTPEAIVDALRRGQFYASQGPKIMKFDLEVITAEKKNGQKYDAWNVSAETSPAKLINFVTNGDWGRWAPAPEGETITAAERILPRPARWVRLEVIDENHKTAWSNPMLVPPAPGMPGYDGY